MLRAAVFAVGLVSAVALTGPAIAQQVLDVPGSGYGAQQRSQYTVADLQRALANAGYSPGRPDGVMGPSTRQALAEFQQDMGLRVTGDPSRQVIRILERRGLLTAQAQPEWDQQQRDWQQPAPQTAQDPARSDPDLVADVQSALQDQGYAVGDVSGELDPETRAAIRNFQRRQGLPATGQPSPELLALIETSGQTPAEMTDAEVIEEIQLRLHNRGYVVGPIDGRVDQTTADAIAAYQADRGLEQTGQASRDLLADLQQSSTAPAQAEAPPGEPVDIFRQLGERALEQLEGGGQQ